MVRRKTPVFLRFATVGGLGVFVNSGILFLLYGVFKTDLVTASMLATECAILSNFYLNNRFTFEGTATRKKLAAFNLFCLGGMMINAVVLSLLAGVGVHYLVANVIGILAAFGTNFAFSRYFVWKKADLK